MHGARSSCNAQQRKRKVQEITHGKVYDASTAPLADKNGYLTAFYSGKVQLGGPLHRLHHVKVTVQKWRA